MPPKPKRLETKPYLASAPSGTGARGLSARRQRGDVGAWFILGIVILGMLSVLALALWRDGQRAAFLNAAGLPENTKTVQLDGRLCAVFLRDGEPVAQFIERGAK